MFNKQEQLQSSEQQKQVKLHHYGPQTAPLTSQQLSIPPQNVIVNTTKSNGILGSYGRLMTKTRVQDFEQLYAENMKLKEKVRELQQNNIKIKTRVSMAQRERQNFITQMYKMQTMHPLRKSRMFTSKTSNHVKYNRKILHGYKGDIGKAQRENVKLKKCIKYTQIQQQYIENQQLQAHLSALSASLEAALDSSAHLDCERQATSISQQIEKQRESARAMYSQIKKKNEELKDLQTKIRTLATHKVDLQRKYSRDLNNVKGLLKPTDQDSRKKDNHTDDHPQKPEHCATCQKYIGETEKERNSNEALQRQIQEKQMKIIELKRKIKEIEINIENNSNRQQIQDSAKQESQLQVDVSESKIIKSNNDEHHNIHNNNNNNLQPPNQQKSTEAKEQPKTIKCSSGPPKEQPEMYEDSFCEFHASKEEEKELQKTLFQKEPELPIEHPSADPKHKQQKMGKSAETKSEKILKSTIKYRLIAQRYTFADFCRDIKNSGATAFSAEELIEMLQNQPFFLNENHLKMVILTIFGKDDIEPLEEVKLKPFLKKMKAYIGDIKFQSEEEEQAILRQIQRKLKKSQVMDRLEEVSTQKEVTPKNFIRVLKETGLTDQQIEQCLAEVSVMSSDISRINYSEFIEKIVGA